MRNNINKKSPRSWNLQGLKSLEETWNERHLHQKTSFCQIGLSRPLHLAPWRRGHPSCGHARRAARLPFPHIPEGRMTLLVLLTLAVALGVVYVIATEISWQKRLADMAREVRERENG